MHFRLLVLPFVAFLSAAALAAPAPNLRCRATPPDNSTVNAQRAAAVKEAFQFAWDGYYKYAFPHDELHPISNGYSDSR